MIAVIGDRLYQWDSNRRVTLTGADTAAAEVHFAQYNYDDLALCVEVKTDWDGKLYAEIPNSLFISSHKLYAWTWRDDHTISGNCFEVLPRARPCDYVYTPTEVKDYEHLKEWVKEQLAQIELNSYDYEALNNKPRIHEVELVGNKELSELGLSLVSNEDIDNLFK